MRQEEDRGKDRQREGQRQLDTEKETINSVTVPDPT